MKASRDNPSYRDIARQAGVSIMTVSLALRNSLRVSGPTKARVRRLAEQLGYSEDPKIAEMMGYLRTRRKARDRPLLALVNAREAPLARLRAAYAAALARSAGAAAEQRGYRLEEFWLGAPGMNERRLSDILEARGIRGILLLPFPPGLGRLDLNWSAFAAVSTCYLSYGIGLHQISSNRQHYLELALRELHALGYRRIGLALDDDMDVRSHHQTLAHFLWDQSRRPLSLRVAPLFTPTLDLPAVRRWLAKTRPDAVVSPRNHVHAILRDLGLKIPRDLGFASLAASAGDVPGLSGVDEKPEIIGEAAVDFLVGQLQHGHLGLPKTRQLVLVEGGWLQGRTVRRRPLL